MKRAISYIVILMAILSCVTPNKYFTGTTDNLNYILDSIGNANAILIPDTSYWRIVWYNSNGGAYWEKYVIINDVGKKHIMTIEPCDGGKINYEYRIEKE